MIVLYSFPGSGRTWLRKMLSDLKCEYEYEFSHGFREHDKFIIHNHLLFKSKKFIYLIRDPFDTLISQYLKRSKKITLEEALFDKCIKHNVFYEYSYMQHFKSNIWEDILLHHISAIKYKNIHPDFTLIRYENLIRSNGLEEFKKIIFNKSKSEISKAWFYEQEKKSTLLNGGGSGKGLKYLNNYHLNILHDVMNKYDYHNKMKELYDLDL